MPKTKAKKPQSKRKKVTTPQPRVERKFVPLLIVFCVVVLVTAGVIFYTAFSKTTITVSTTAVDEERDFSYTAETVNGIIEEATFEHSYVYDSFSDAPSEPAQATGSVTLINNHSADQPLVATTRLLSESGVLFRMEDTVTVPAGGTIDVDVYADEEGGSGNITADTFEIVALQPGLKEDIYAESDSPMTGGLVGGTEIEEAHIGEALELAQSEIMAQAIEEISAITTGDASLINASSVEVVLDEQTVTPEAGTVGNEISVETVVTASITIVDKILLAEKISKESGADVKPERVEYTVETNESGTVVMAIASIRLATDDLSFIKKAELTDKTAQQVEEYITQFEQVDQVQVEFNPFWVRTTPLNTQSIVIELSE